MVCSLRSRVQWAPLKSKRVEISRRTPSRALSTSAISVFETVVAILRTYLFSHTTNRIDVELGARLFRHLMALPLAYFQARRVGDSVARVRELDSIRRQGVADAREAAQDAARRLTSGYPVDPQEITKLAGRMQALGDKDGATRLRNAAAMQDDIAAFGRMPLDQQQEELARLERPLLLLIYGAAVDPWLAIEVPGPPIDSADYLPTVVRPTTRPSSDAARPKWKLRPQSR